MGLQDHSAATAVSTLYHGVVGVSTELKDVEWIRYLPGHTIAFPNFALGTSSKIFSLEENLRVVRDIFRAPTDFLNLTPSITWE